MNTIQLNCINKPKDFWKFVKDKKQINFLPKNMQLNGQYSDDLETITRKFKDFFATVYSPSKSSNTKFPTKSSDGDMVDLSSCFISISEVFEELSLLKPDIKSEPDLIPSLLLFNCRYSLSRPLHFIFTQSLLSGTFPSCWKLSFIYISNF